MVNLSSNFTKILGSYGSNIGQFNVCQDIFNVGASIYILDAYNSRIQKWSLTGDNASTYLISGAIWSAQYMFIDKYNNLYTSTLVNNTVLKFSENSSVYKVIAGNQIAGFTLQQLSSPKGVFVDDLLNLYIADYGNNRVQLWQNGSTFGRTVAGNGTPGNTFSQVIRPSAIVVDKYDYMYMTDEMNHQILRWKLNDTAGICIAACTGVSGKNMNQLSAPDGLAFDSNGSLYVSEYSNNRVHKFKVFNYQSRIS